MTKEKGVTLISLAIYVATILIVIGILATITGAFKNNIKEINSRGTNNYEIDKFNLYFLKEVKKQGNEIESISQTGNEILFTSGNKYTFESEDNCIYLNDSIKIAENIQSCTFSSSTENEKTVITVTIQAINADEKVLTYVMSEDNDALQTTLPPEYQRVEYIESTGTQYIDTGITTSTDLKVNAIVEPRQLYNHNYSMSLFGGRISTTNNNFTYSSGDGYDYFGIGNNYIQKNNIPLNEKVILEYTTQYININSQNYNYMDNSYSFTITNQCNLYIFTFNENGAVNANKNGAWRIYSFKLLKSDKTVRNFIPCKSTTTVTDVKGNSCSKGTIGLYDTVNNKFYTNDGSYSFIAGPEIETNNTVIGENEKEYIYIPPTTRLPSSYQKVEYIESTGTQYIDIGYYCSSNTDIRIAFTYINSNDDGASNGMIFGSANTAYGRPSFSIGISNNETLYYRNSDSAETLTAVYPLSKDVVYEISCYKNQVVINNSKYNADMSLITEVQLNSAYLFARHQPAASWAPSDYSKLIGSIYYCKLYEKDILQRDFIPCYCTTTVTDVKGNSCPAGTVGLYDMVTGEFYTNDGSGTFIAGPEIYNLPSEYQQLEYIESTGTQYIDTGVGNTIGFKAELTGILTNKTNSVPTIIGCSLGENKRSFFDINEQGYWRIGIGTSYTASTMLAQINQKNEFEVSTISGNAYIKLNGTYISQKTDSYIGTSYNIYLFSRNNVGSLSASTFSSIKLYNLKLYNELEVLQRNFVPCKTTTTVTDVKGNSCTAGTVGLYDMVTGEFYTNDGTGTFTAGPNV